jgi:N-acetylglucosamine malate deacetylase 1
MTVDVLAIGAHPDDVEIFAGGTLAALAAQGLRTAIVHLTRGECGSRGTPEQRHQEAVAAAAALGAAEVRVLDLGDTMLSDSAPGRASLISIMRELRPRLVLAPLSSDDHPDHAAAGQLAKSSWYLSGIRRAFADPSNAHHRPEFFWSYVGHEHPSPSLVFALDEKAVDAKMKAIYEYASQFDERRSSEPRTRISHPRFMAAIRARLLHYGALVNAEFGEPFILPRPVKLRSMASLFGSGEPDE